jgi:hypothetical protein
VAARDGVIPLADLDDGAIMVDDLGRPLESVVPAEAVLVDG